MNFFYLPVSHNHKLESHSSWREYDCIPCLIFCFTFQVQNLIQQMVSFLLICVSISIQAKICWWPSLETHVSAIQIPGNVWVHCFKEYPSLVINWIFYVGILIVKLGSFTHCLECQWKTEGAESMIGAMTKWWHYILQNDMEITLVLLISYYYFSDTTLI